MFDTAGMAAHIWLDCPPRSGDLRMWGLLDGEWYALLEWEAHCTDDRTPGHSYHGLLFCLGWISSVHVQRDAGADYTAIPRVRLHGDPQHWPTPVQPNRRTEYDHYFGLLDGKIVPPLPGIRWM